MALELDQTKIIAQSQRFIFENCVIQKNPELSANIQFAVYNQDDVRIGTQNYEYRGDLFNYFWANFNSGTFLYDELDKKSMLPIQVDSSVEQDFVYVAPPAPTNQDGPSLPIMSDAPIPQETNIIDFTSTVSSGGQ